MVMGKLYRHPTPTGHLQLGQVVSTLFPTQPPLTWQATGEGDTVLTSEAEVLAALRKTKIEEAPGPDGIPNAALHTLVTNYPGIFTSKVGAYPKTGQDERRRILIQTPMYAKYNGEDIRAHNLHPPRKRTRPT